GTSDLPPPRPSPASGGGGGRALRVEADPSPVHRSACSPCAPDLLPPPPAGEGRGGGSRACPTHAAATPSACRHERLDLVGAARQAVGEHFVAVLRDRHVVLDPDPDATPLRGHAGVVGGYVEPRLDREHHARL